MSSKVASPARASQVAVRSNTKKQFVFSKPKHDLKFNVRIVAFISLLAGIAITYWSYRHGAILAYGDAEAHLNISKRVVNGLTPGFAQLGSVWLPLPHLLMAPFSIINSLWYTGLAGSIVSVLAFVWLNVMLYKLAYEITGNLQASYLAPLVAIVNPNSLYLASTPMTETLLLSMFASSVYYFVRWLRSDKLLDIIIASFFTAGATLSRYDGWALVCIETVLLAMYAFKKYRSYKTTEGIVGLYSFVAFFGIVLWFLWNKLIFNSFTYFSASVYGSKEQQQFFLKSGYLPTYHNLGKSIIYFLEDIRLVIGLPVVLLSLAGMIFFTYKMIKLHQARYLALVILSLTPIYFYVLSLYLGQASLILPTFAHAGDKYTVSNVRYGYQILLAVAVFLAYLGARSKKLLYALAVIVLLQSFYFLKTNTVITYIDGTKGLSSQKISKGPDAPSVEQYLKTHYDGGLIFMDDYRRPISPVSTRIPVGKFIGVGNKPYWKESMDDPGKYATWVVLQKADTDAIWQNLHRKDLLSEEFVTVYNKGNLYVYKKRAQTKDFVVKTGQHLSLNNQPFTINGVNSYDLLSQSDATIDTRFKELSTSGFNTVRLWCFNNRGALSTNDLNKLDTVVATADKYDVHLICVLGNSYNDFGGPSYLGAKDLQDFFSSPAIRMKYKQQIHTLLTHTSSFRNGKTLASSKTILAWETLNEPRIESDQSSATVYSWTKDIAQYILTLDTNHLISPGTEGFTQSYPGQLYNQQHGSSIEKICAIDAITLCSAHLYPKYLDNAATPSNQSIQTTIQTWREIGNKLNKPIYIGETGYDLSTPDASNETRQNFFNTAMTSAKSSKIDGELLWNFGDKSDPYFTLSYNDPGTATILQNWHK